MLQSMMAVKIVRKVTEAEDIAVFELADPAGADLPPFAAGSHIDVEVMPGLTRQYSLCNNPSERKRYVIGVLKDPASRGGSLALHAFAQGQDIRISAPRNHFELYGPAQRSVLFAGGIGITPILCMAERLAAIGAEFGLHYCARTPARAAFRDRIAASSFAARAHLHFDDGDASQKLDIESALGAADPETHIYVCGPGPFIDFVLGAARAKGFTETQLHREYFGANAAATHADGASFQVKIASTGAIIDVPSDTAVTDALMAHGIDVPISCGQGVCGTCLTSVLSGVPDHRDYYLTDDERAKNDQFLPCCSRAKTPMLVLDI